MRFKIVGEITDVKIIAVGKQIRDLDYLQRAYEEAVGASSRDLPLIELSNGRIRKAELHWYQAHGIGKVDVKRKRFDD